MKLLNTFCQVGSRKIGSKIKTCFPQLCNFRNSYIFIICFNTFESITYKKYLQEILITNKKYISITCCKIIDARSSNFFDM